MERETEVFIEIDRDSFLVGRLWSRATKGRESASFEYDKTWITSELRFPLEPVLTMDAGIHHTQPGKPLFGAIGDAAPDRWGRTLMRRSERKTEVAFSLNLNKASAEIHKYQRLIEGILDSVLSDRLQADQ